MKGYLCGLVVGIGLFTAVGLGLSRTQLTLNVGQSLPASVFYCRPWNVWDRWERGRVVYYVPPPRVQEAVRRMAPQADLRLPWLKQLAAIGGDTVCWGESQITVNGVSVGALPLADEYGLQAPETCQELGEDEVLPLGSHPRSFDGRYTGPLWREEIDKLCTALW